MFKNIFSPNDKEEEKSRKLRELGIYLGLGLQLAVTVAVLAFLGIWLDKKFDTTPWLTIIFSFLGVITGMYTFLKTVLNKK